MSRGEIKNIRGSRTTLPLIVNGKQGFTCIANQFAEKYKALYNSVSSNNNVSKTIKASFNRDIQTLVNATRHWLDNNSIDFDDLKNIIQNMKPGKSGGVTILCSDNYIHGTNKLLHCITYYYF